MKQLVLVLPVITDLSFKMENALLIPIPVSFPKATFFVKHGAKKPVLNAVTEASSMLMDYAFPSVLNVTPLIRLLEIA